MRKYVTIKYVGVVLLSALGLTSCTTTYDAYGRPVETIDPAAAAVGAIAIGAAGYAIGHNNSHDYNRHRGHHGGHHSGHRRHR